MHDHMHLAAERLKALSDALRALEQAEYCPSKTVDLNDVIRESIVITQVRGSASIKSNLGDLPPVSCFRTRIGQVVTNLISNTMDVLAAQPAKQGHGIHQGKIEITSTP